MSSSDQSPRLPPNPHLWQIRAVRDLLWVGFAVFVIWFGYELQAIFTPVLIALALAYLFHPVITQAQRRWGWPRSLTVAALLTILVIVLVLVALFIVPLLVRQFIAVTNSIEQFLQDPPEPVREWAAQYGIQIGDWSKEIDALIQYVRSNPLQVARVAFAGGGTAAGIISTVLGSALYFIVTIALIPIYFFFFAWKFPRLAQVQEYFPHHHRDHALRILQRMDMAVSSFFRGRLIIAFIMGLMFWLGWELAGVPYSFLLGMLTGLLSIVPYAAGIGWPVAMLLAYLDIVAGTQPTIVEGVVLWPSVVVLEGTASAWPSILWGAIIWPTVVYVAVQLIEGWLLTPWIQSHSTNLSAATILIVVFIGGAVAGLYGLILAIPIAACLKILLQDLFLPRLQQWARNH